MQWRVGIRVSEVHVNASGQIVTLSDDSQLLEVNGDGNRPSVKSQVDSENTGEEIKRPSRPFNPGFIPDSVRP